MVPSTSPNPLVGAGVNAGEVGRFAVTGGAAYLVDVLVFNACLLGIGTDHLSAKAVSSVVAITVAYLGSRYYTWPHQQPRGAHPVLTFVALSVAAAGVQLACLWISHDLVGWTSPIVDNISANIVGMGLATLLRFWGFRTFIFQNPTAEHKQTGTGTSGTPSTDTAPGHHAVTPFPVASS